MRSYLDWLDEKAQVIGEEDPEELKEVLKKSI